MNINRNISIPEWALTICEKYGLHERSDTPDGGLSFLLMDAAHDLREAALTIMREDAATPDTLRSIADVATMVKDALALTAVCGDQPSPGRLEQQPDGWFILRPAAADQI